VSPSDLDPSADSAFWFLAGAMILFEVVVFGWFFGRELAELRSEDTDE
jgi:hypothetical protein